MSLLLIGRDRPRLDKAALTCRDHGANVEIAAIDHDDVVLGLQAGQLAEELGPLEFRKVGHLRNAAGPGDELDAAGQIDDSPAAACLEPVCA